MFSNMLTGQTERIKRHGFVHAGMIINVSDTIPLQAGQPYESVPQKITITVDVLHAAFVLLEVP